MAKEAAVKAEQADERKRFLWLEQLASCWEETREALRGDQPHPSEQKGDRMAPRWNNSSSSVLFSKAGGESFELYDSFTSLRDQSSLVANNPVRVEEYGVHAQLQALTFFRSLSIKCTTYRKNNILSDRKVKELQAQLADRDRTDRAHVEEMQTLLEKLWVLERRACSC
ncbi:UNVERIFIED_CONTAM: hypothetical protein Sindi_2006700 [Sesamum indicum]